MDSINWMDKLKWTDEHIEDLRYTGFSYIRQGKYDIALAFFEALEILDPQNIYDVQTLGALYLQLNQYQKALKCFDRALKLDTEDHGPTLLNLAKTFFAMGKKEEGLKLVNILKNEKNPSVANMAKALFLAYS
jgi:tetratricopeptide (TPR) repeat protein